MNWSSYSTFGTPRGDGEFKTPVVNWKVHAPLQFTTGKCMWLGHVGVTNWYSRQTRSDWNAALDLCGSLWEQSMCDGDLTYMLQCIHRSHPSRHLPSHLGKTHAPNASLGFY